MDKLDRLVQEIAALTGRELAELNRRLTNLGGEGTAGVREPVVPAPKAPGAAD